MSYPLLLKASCQLGKNNFQQLEYLRLESGFNVEYGIADILIIPGVLKSFLGNKLKSGLICQHQGGRVYITQVLVQLLE